MSSIPTHQKAWRIKRRGVPSKALVFEAESPVPADLKDGEVLVKVQAAALNPVGYKLMEILPATGLRNGLSPEHDFSGIVVDQKGTTFKSGDRVFGSIGADIQGKIGQGVLCEYTKVPSNALTTLPDGYTFTQAAGVMLAGETAYQCLYTIGDLQPGQSLFINGGSSSVGIAAIQMAKAQGCKVVVSASARNEALVKSLGADEVIDYTKVSISEHLAKNPPSPKFAIILDAIGLVDPSLYVNSEAYLSPDGIYVTTSPNVKLQGKSIYDFTRQMIHAFLIPSWLGGVKRKYKWMLLKPNVNIVDMRKLLAEGTLKPVVDSVYSLDDALKAYDRMMSSRATGKVVVKIDPTCD